MSQMERFGKYILLEKLASGGMAEIYLAKSIGAQGVNKFLAVKRILPQFCENPEFKEMFREEAKVSVNLRHSNVVPIFDFGEERQQFYLVMDYVEGRNMRQILNELKKLQIQFQIEQICYMIREAAAGLDHAHRCIDGSTGRPLNIIHRDISPQNIMISFEGEVKIIDFGIAKAETQLEATKAGTLKGKFGYMSPEQADGQTIDVRTDIFSLGIVLWELLANDRLFTASSEAAILRKIRECQVPSIRKINPNVPPELEKIVNKVLAKDPNLRYQTAAALHKDLNRFLNTQYPDFNAQDFAVFIKNAFAQSYQESKRKLVEYAKMNHDEKSLAAGPAAPASASAPAVNRNDATIIDRAPDDDLGLNTSTQHKVDLTGIRNNLPPAPPGTPAGTRSQIQHTITQATRTGLTMGTRTGMTPRPQPVFQTQGPDIVGWIVKGGVTMIFVVGGWWSWKNGVIKDLLNAGKGAAPAIAKDETKPPVGGTHEEASKGNYQVTISSDPSGARIYFDCQDQGAFTPKIFNMEGNKQVHVTLKKEGFFHYEIEFQAVKDAQSLRGVLQPLGRAAYVQINVLNGGVDPIVEVNGRRICDHSNGMNYPIPAGVPVQIRARNSFGAMAETTVTLDADQKKAVELILGTAN